MNIVGSQEFLEGNEDTDVYRLVHALLSNTSLCVKVHGKRGKSFTTNVGSPQGDSLSAILFNIYYEAALKSVRSKSEEPPEKDAILGIPSEMQFADDLDFFSTSETYLESVFNVCSNELPNWNLKVNGSKTERVKIFISAEEDERGAEEWRGEG